MESWPGLLKELPSYSLNGMRFTLDGMPWMSFTNLFASSGESLTSFMRTYSKVIIRRDGKGNFLQASISCGSGYFLLIGISWSRWAFVVALRDTARLTITACPSKAISGSSPEVDTVTLRLEN